MRLEIHDDGPPFKLTMTMLRTFGDVIMMGEMAGARFYQPALARLACMRPRDGFPCVLLPQPANPHDPNAIAIWTRGGHVGYIPRLEAPALRPALAKLEGALRHLGLGVQRAYQACRADAPPSAAGGDPVRFRV